MSSSVLIQLHVKTSINALLEKKNIDEKKVLQNILKNFIEIYWKNTFVFLDFSNRISCYIFESKTPFKMVDSNMFAWKDTCLEVYLINHGS